MSGIGDSEKPVYPVFEEGAWVHASDKDNIGQIVKDLGSQAAEATVYFYNKDNGY